MRPAHRRYWRALWPAFLVALPATGLLFSAIDPRSLVLFGVPMAFSRAGGYTAGLIVLWLLCWVASVLNLWMFGGPVDDDDGGLLE